MNSKAHSNMVCPRCRQDLRPKKDGLVCEPCELFFPIEDGIPNLLIQKAKPLSEISSLSGMPATGGSARFEIQEGLSKGERINLEKGCCKALGRSIENIDATRVMTSSPVASLDDYSRRLVVRYVEKQYGESVEKKGDLGGFHREPDWLVQDEAVSRLHAMLFYGDLGVGILDLVSRNGTYVNGVEVESKLLQSGDSIQIGGVKIKFVSLS